MFHIKHRCPHCLNKGALQALMVLDYQPTSDAEENRRLRAQQAGGAPILNGKALDTFADPTKCTAACRCPECQLVSLVHCEIDISKDEMIKDVLMSQSGHYGGRCDVLGTTPKPEKFAAHPSWPEAVQELFVHTKEMAAEGRPPAMIVGSLRSCLEVSVKQLLGPDYEPTSKKEDNLLARINAVEAMHLISPTIKDWAHRVRIEGNDAIHEIKATREEADELLAFTDLFLHVCFELPAKIKEWQAKRDADRGR